MGDLKLCLIIFVVSLILRFGLYLIIKKKSNSFNLMMEMKYLINRFRLNKKLINTIPIAFLLSLMDAFVISFTLFLTMSLSKNVVLEILIAFVLVFGLILLFNELIGRVLKMKGYDKK